MSEQADDWDREPHPWEGRDPKSPWNDNLMVHGWYDPSSCDVETLYQAFKARLLVELVAEEVITHDCIQRFPLKDITQP